MPCRDRCLEERRMPEETLGFALLDRDSIVRVKGWFAKAKIESILQALKYES